MAREESFTGPYRYLSLTFAEQNAALKINNPLEPGYRPGAQYLLGTRGTVKLYERVPA